MGSSAPNPHTCAPTFSTSSFIVYLACLGVNPQYARSTTLSLTVTSMSVLVHALAIYME